jgi:hypothetical protein
MSSIDRKRQLRDAARRYRAAHPDRHAETVRKSKQKRNPTGKRPSRETIGERRLTHGHTTGRKTSRTYRAWNAMITRCSQHERYAGRGISVCDRWKDFDNFLADMGVCPEGKTLDRHPNNDGNYEPSNCRWATRKEQARNRSTVRPVIRSDGIQYPSMAEAAEAVGGNRRCIRDVCTGRQKTHLGFGWSFT